MNANILFSLNGKLHTKNGASSLTSCGVSSSEKGITVAFSCLADSQERMSIWYLRAIGEAATDYLYFKNIIDIRTCTLNGGSIYNAVRLTGKNGELYILEFKTPSQACDLADKLCNLAKEHLEANRELAEKLQLTDKGSSPDSAEIVADHVTISNVDPADKASNRNKSFLHILGIIMQTLGYLLLIGMVSAFINNGANTDWTGAGFGFVALIALIIGGTVLTKKN